jgi:hypothetical protein
LSVHGSAILGISYRLRRKNSFLDPKSRNNYSFNKGEIHPILLSYHFSFFLCVFGHNYPDKRLLLYLPGNGGLLAVMALMTAGWDGNNTPTPGFPKDGKWNVKWEGIKPMP